MSAFEMDQGQPGAYRPSPIRRENVWIRARRNPQMRIGGALFILILLLAIVGPTVAPHSPGEFVARPYSPPSSSALLGTDVLGRDVLSRLLNGGRTVVGLSLAATFVGVGIGIILGLLAGYSRSILDDFLMGTMDIVLAFPQIVLALLFVSILGPKLWLIVLIVAVSHAPRVARLTRGITLELREREFIELAALLGIARRAILLREVLPNLATPLLVEFGLRLTWSIGIIAGLSFLGFGIQPPTSDWGLMINENRGGLTIQALAVVAPVFCIFVYTIAANFLAEGLSRTIARTREGDND